MDTVFIETTQDAENGWNWGKFMVGRFTTEEWARSPAIGSGRSLVAGRGWREKHLLVLDLQTGEGAIFLPGGLAAADLTKHRVWVCPMFEPFLIWLYQQDLSNLAALPKLVELPDVPPAFAGYRRPGEPA